METFLFLGVLLAGGYVLGIIGFFRANSAHTELRALRRALADLASHPAAARQPPAGEAPFVLPQAAGDRTSEPPPIPEEWLPPSPELPSPEPPAPPAEPPRDLESLLTARWGIWLGSAALLLAGVFLIRYAVEEELLGPAARCVLAGLLGFALLAVAEFLVRHEPPAIPGPFRADQAPAALAAGGTAILFGAAYGAGPFYGLLPPTLSFICMAAASFVALAASLRYGKLTAATGIAGAFVTPALVVTDNPSLPGLFAYLFLVSVAALAVVRYTAWTWLGWATTVAGAIWVCLAAVSGGTDLWAAAVFIPAATTLHLVLLPAAALDHPVGRRLAWVPFAAIGVAGLVLETQDPGSVTRFCLFLLSPIAVWRGLTEARLDRLPWLAALVGMLTLLLWALPEWNPTGETITVEGMVEAVLPGAWAPAVIRPLIIAATLFAAFHVMAGGWLERRAPHPMRWAALATGVPVMTFAVLYAQVARFQGDARWAIVALGLAIGLSGPAANAASHGAPQRAGVHAAGVVAALALGCAALLHEHWLTLAIALYLPALAWIEARADLPALRHVALAVAGVILVRLVLNWYILDYAFGVTPLANGLIAAYAAPAASFAIAAFLFRRRDDDRLVAVSEAGAVTLASIFVALEIRHAFGLGQLENPFGFNEIALHLLTLSVQATMYLYVANRTGRRMLVWAWHVLGALAFCIAALALLFNPAFTGAQAGVIGLAAAYLVPAVLAVLSRRWVSDRSIRQALGAYALVSLFVWISLQIRVSFHPGQMSVIDGPIADAELWAWSGAWLVYGVGLMVLGIRAEDRIVRLAAIAVVGLVCAKVFLLDMADLTGLWRVLSFLGLGLALIGLGVVHRRFVLQAK